MTEQTKPVLPAHWPTGPSEPRVSSATCPAPGKVVLKLDVKGDCPWLDGHFPDQPVLPGVVQLRWAVQLAALIWPQLDTVTAVSNLKFQHTVLPPAQLRLELQRHPETARVDFAWFVDDQRCALGRVAYA